MWSLPSAPNRARARRRRTSSRQAASSPARPPTRLRSANQKTPEQRQAELRARYVDGPRHFAESMTEEHPGLRFPQKRCGAWQRGSDWPAHQNFQQFGGFTVLLAEATASSAPVRA